MASMIKYMDSEGWAHDVCTANDMNAADGNPIRMEMIKGKSSCVSKDGVIYYVDTNLNFIRQIKKL